MLRDHPRIGRVSRVRSAREIVTGDRPVVAHRLASPGTIEILRVLHTARRWPGEL